MTAGRRLGPMTLTSASTSIASPLKTKKRVVAAAVPLIPIGTAGVEMHHLAPVIPTQRRPVGVASTAIVRPNLAVTVASVLHVSVTSPAGARAGSPELPLRLNRLRGTYSVIQ
jgi:hypothetical protein